jgi:hypothetical protein
MMENYLSITLSGLLFFLMGLLIAFKLTSIPIGLKLKLYFWHSFFSFLYAFYTVVGTKSADSIYYYRDGELKAGLSTSFILSLTYSLKNLFFASYLDLFLLYQIAGFVGILLLYDVVKDYIDKKSRFQKLLFFIPGIHFWTSALGKDSLVFLGIVMVLWSANHLSSRYIQLLCGFVLTFLIRPHIAGILVLSGLLSIVMASNVSIPKKTVAFTFMLLLAAAIIPQINEFTGLDSFDSADEYISKRQGYNMDSGGGINISEMPFAMQFLTYLYRPLFFEVQDILGLIVSFENLILIFQSLELLSVKKPWFFLVYLL